VSKTTLKALERAAMRWYRSWDIKATFREIGLSDDALARACARHAQSKKGKRK